MDMVTLARIRIKDTLFLKKDNAKTKKLILRGVHHSNILAILRIWSKLQTKHYKISQILQNIDTNSRNDKSLRDFELLKEYAKIMLV